jgi:hypothetical protein
LFIVPLVQRGVKAACSLGLSATSQQYFSLTSNQPPASSQQYSSLRTNQHQPSATSQPNRLEISFSRGDQPQELRQLPSWILLNKSICCVVVNGTLAHNSAVV